MNLIEDSYISFVNLAHRTDRLKRMEKNLAAVGVPAVRTPGILPKDLKGDLSKYQVMIKRTIGACGCHEAQVNVMTEALRQCKHAWVMEDDLDFCSDFPKRLKLMEEFLSTREWDIMWLGATFHIHPPWWHKTDLGRDAELTDNPRFLRTYGAFCTYAYIVNKDSVEKILSWLDAIVHTSMGIDWAMIQLQPKLQTFAFVPGSIKQFDNKSDIGKGETTFSNFKKLGPYWFQEKLEDFDPSKFSWHEAKV